MNKTTSLMLLVAATLPVTLAGCGGTQMTTHATQSAQTAGDTGRATLAVRWPQRGRLVPFAANSVRVSVFRGNSLLGEQLITRPASGGESSATFDRLPVGDATVRAVAYPNADGTGVAQAQADTSIVVKKGEVSPVRVTMASTVTTFAITPAVSLLNTGQSVRLSATARNAAGETVLTAPGTITWSSRDGAVAGVNFSGTVTAVAPGTVTIEASESESGKVASLRLDVTPAPSPTPSPTPGVLPPGVREVNLLVNDLQYDAVSGRLYATVPSKAGANGNSVSAIDPVTGAVGAPVFVGSEPGTLALSDNGQYAYTGLRGAPRIRRVNLATGTADAEYSLAGNHYARRIFVQPGNANVVAVERSDSTEYSFNNGIVILDGGVPRADVADGQSNTIGFGVSPSRLYATSPFSSTIISRFDVDAKGIRLVDTSDTKLFGFGTDLVYEGGRIYSGSGSVLEAESYRILGKFAAEGMVRPASELGLVFYVFAVGNGSPPFNPNAPIYVITHVTQLGFDTML